MKTEDIIKAYDKIYATSGLKVNSGYYRWIVRLFKPKPNTKVLDVSCGEGMLLNEIIKLKKGIKAYGLDISNVAVSIARVNASESKIIIADGQKIPFKDNYFDYITCLGSLEHYLESEAGLRELLRVAKKDAKFCIALPNSISIDLFLEVLKMGDRPKENFQIIERNATKNEWLSLLIKNGFHIESIHSSNLWPELFQDGTYKIKSLSKYFKRLLIRYFCPLNLSREFVFICTKKFNR